MEELKKKVLENLKTKGYPDYQLKQLNPIIEATIDATKQALKFYCWTEDSKNELCLEQCDNCKSDLLNKM